MLLLLLLVPVLSYQCLCFPLDYGCVAAERNSAPRLLLISCGP